MVDFLKSLSLFSGAALCTVISVIIVALFHKRSSINFFSLAIPFSVSYLIYWVPKYIKPTSDQYGSWAWLVIPVWSMPGIVLALGYVGYNLYSLKKRK